MIRKRLPHSGNYLYKPKRLKTKTPSIRPSENEALFSQESQISSAREQKSGNRRLIEDVAMYFGIIGVIVSTFFAWITYINTDQIRELQSLVKKTDTTVSRLIAVNNELKTANLANRELMRIQNDQLTTSSLLQRKTNAIFELQNAANEMRFKAFVLSLSDYIKGRNEYNT